MDLLPIEIVVKGRYLRGIFDVFAILLNDERFLIKEYEDDIEKFVQSILLVTEINDC